MPLSDNVKPVLSPRSRPSKQYGVIPSKIREYFDLETGDLLKWDVEGDKIVITVIRKEKLLEMMDRLREAQSRS